MFSASTSRLEVGDGAGLRGRQVGRVAEREHVRRRRSSAACACRWGRSRARRRGPASARRTAAPPCSGTVTSRSKSSSRAVVGGELAADPVDLAGVELGHELDLLLAEQPGQVLGGDRLGEGSRRAASRSTSSVRSRMPRSRRYQSARKANSSGATGHLIGMSTTFTTSRPPSKRSSAPCEGRGALGRVEGEDALVPARRRSCPRSPPAGGATPLATTSTSYGSAVPSSSSTSSRSSATSSTSLWWKTMPPRSWRAARPHDLVDARRARRARTAARAGRRAGRRGRRRGSRPRRRSKRRRSRLAVIVPPVPPPRITMRLGITGKASGLCATAPTGQVRPLARRTTDSTLVLAHNCVVVLGSLMCPSPRSHIRFPTLSSS